MPLMISLFLVLHFHSVVEYLGGFLTSLPEEVRTSCPAFRTPGPRTMSTVSSSASPAVWSMDLSVDFADDVDDFGCLAVDVDAAVDACSGVVG